jgi:hypothetical protein
MSNRAFGRREVQFAVLELTDVSALHILSSVAYNVEGLQYVCLSTQPVNGSDARCVQQPVKCNTTFHT